MANTMLSSPQVIVTDHLNVPAASPAIPAVITADVTPSIARPCLFIFSLFGPLSWVGWLTLLFLFLLPQIQFRSSGKS